LLRAGAELCFGDVTQPAAVAAAVQGTDVVFHAAGLTRALRAQDLQQVNGQGTWNVSQACAAQPQPPVLVVVSSLAAAGPARQGTTRTESDPPAPVSNYGRSKRAGELAAAAWASRVPTTIVRPGVVFGPANREMLDMFRTIAAAGVHVTPSFAPPPLSVIFVDDLIQILLLAAERGARIPAGTPNQGRSGNSSQGYYFACTTEYPTWAELGRAVADCLGYRHLCSLNFVESFVWLVAGVNELISRLRGQPHPLSLDKMREALVASWASSPASVQRDLGFVAPRSVRQRLQETVDWYLRHRWISTARPFVRLRGVSAPAPKSRRLVTN
jgi:nucleoside-diphosphate-sugar epimerase